MKLTTLLLSSMLLATASCADYPQHEPALTDTDIHKSGPGPHGGIEGPTNNNAQPPAPTTTPTY